MSYVLLILLLTHYYIRCLRTELTYGAVLGVGGFSAVLEIRGVQLESTGTGTGQPMAEDSRPDDGDEDFYMISTARDHIAKRCLRDGEARYAVKMLYPHQDPLTLARGMVDLAIEAKYLSVLSHSNIVKMRGISKTDGLHPSGFLILDRLYGTLGDKITEWREAKKSLSGPIRGLNLGSDKKGLQEFMQERLIVAYDLAAAFRYMHENK